ncbi:Adenylate cyclase [Smittium culicis]|uniref:Adenylate cyclase n=1 Tax=Smittium culicis TaxID=133412 RepID=A0A1R1WZJ3_9FUNG|nr:Adenylate cyclase [Smittium culicis]
MNLKPKSSKSNLNIENNPSSSKKTLGKIGFFKFFKKKDLEKTQISDNENINELSHTEIPFKPKDVSVDNISNKSSKNNNKFFTNRKESSSSSNFIHASKFKKSSFPRNSEKSLVYGDIKVDLDFSDISNIVDLDKLKNNHSQFSNLPNTQIGKADFTSSKSLNDPTSNNRPIDSISKNTDGPSMPNIKDQNNHLINYTLKSFKSSPSFSTGNHPQEPKQVLFPCDINTPESYRSSKTRSKSLTSSVKNFRPYDPSKKSISRASLAHNSKILSDRISDKNKHKSANHSNIQNYKLSLNPRKDSCFRSEKSKDTINLTELERLYDPNSFLADSSYISPDQINDFDSYLRKESLSRDSGAWAVPESWSVVPLPNSGADITLSGSFARSSPTETRESTPEFIPTDDFKKYRLRLYREDAGFGTFNIKLLTTVSELLNMAGKKFFINDISLYCIYITDTTGLNRILTMNEMPAYIFKTTLKNIGYTSRDNLSGKGIQDYSYVCKFTLVKAGITSVSLNIGTLDSNVNEINLENKCLQTIPVPIYNHAMYIHTLNLSKNPSINLPSDFLQECVSLNSLNISNCYILKVPQSLQFIPHLTILNLNSNMLKKVGSTITGFLVNLKVLNLDNNKISDLPASLANLKSLKVLSLKNNLLKSFPSVITRLTNLENLDVSYNLIGLIPESISNLTNLKYLNFTGNYSPGILSKGISKLVNLETFHLELNNFLDISPISKLPSLKYVFLGNNKVTNPLLNSAAIQTIYFNHNKIADITICSKLENLTTLDLGFNKLTELPKDLFLYLNRLETIILDNNHLVALPRSVSELTRLTKLSLSTNSLSTLPKELFMLQNLKLLDVHRNKLKSIPSEIWLMPKLTTINFSSNVLDQFPHPTSLNNSSRNNNGFGSVRTAAFSSPSIAQRLKLAHSKSKEMGQKPKSSTDISSDLASLSNSVSNQLISGSEGNFALYKSNNATNLEDLPECTCNSENSILPKTVDITKSASESLSILAPKKDILTRSNPTISLYESADTNNKANNNNPDSSLDKLGSKFGTSFVNHDLTCPHHPNQFGNFNNALSESSNSISQSNNLTHPLNENKMKNTLSFETGGSLGANRVKSIKFSSSVLPPLSFSLKEINIANNFLGDDFLILCEYLPELAVLNISYNDLYEIPIASMSYMNKISELYLSGTKLSTIPEEDSSLKYWKDLRVLFLNMNKLQSLPSWFAKLSNLTVLDASNNQLKYNITNWQYDWNWNWNLELQYLNFSHNTRLEIVGQRFVGKKLHGSTINEDTKSLMQNQADFLEKRSNILRVGPYTVPKVLPDPSQDMSDFYKLKNLRTLGLLQLTVMVPLPEESPMRRIRMTEELKFVHYGIADSLGNDPTVSLRDLVSSKSTSTQNEVVFGIFHAQNCPPILGSVMVKYLSEKFVSVFKKELDDLEDYFKNNSINSSKPAPSNSAEPVPNAPLENALINGANNDVLDSSKINTSQNISGKKSNLVLNFFNSKDKDTANEGTKKSRNKHDIDKSYKTKKLPPTSDQKVRAPDLSLHLPTNNPDTGPYSANNDTPGTFSSVNTPIIPLNIDTTRPNDFVTDAIRKTFLEVNKELGSEMPNWKFSSSIYNQLDFPSVPSFTSNGNYDSNINSDFADDQNFSKLCKEYSFIDYKNVKSFIGASAIVAFVQNQTLYIANLGDAKGVLSRRGNPVILSTLHTVSNKEENLRVRSLSGNFPDGEILSNKILTRGFGCFGKMPYVNAEPTIRSLQLGKDDEFIILGNNALWNYVSAELAVEVARYHRNDPVVASSRLRDYAIAYGSKKAIMVMVIQFKPSDIKTHIGILKCKSVRESVLGSRSGKSRMAILNPEKKNDSNLPTKTMKSSQVDLAFGTYKINLNDIESDDDFEDEFDRNDKSSVRRQRLRNHQGSNKDHALSRNVIGPPVGEVALVFTDVKNSTSQWDANPAAMRQAIKIHNRVMRKILKSAGGYEVKTEGDAFMVSFSTVASALNWCLSVQLAFLDVDWPQDILETEDGKPIYFPDDNIPKESSEELNGIDKNESGSITPNNDKLQSDINDVKKLIYRGLRIRMGIHVGTPLCEEDPITSRMDYFGPMVNRAARVSGVADGGQIYVSNDVAEEVVAILNLFKVATEENITDMSKLIRDPKLAKDVQMLWNVGMGIQLVGEKKLKGLETPETIYKVYPASLRLRLEHEEELNKQSLKPHYNAFIDAKDNELKKKSLPGSISSISATPENESNTANLDPSTSEKAECSKVPPLPDKNHQSAKHSSPLVRPEKTIANKAKLNDISYKIHNRKKDIPNVIHNKLTKSDNKKAKRKSLLALSIKAPSPTKNNSHGTIKLKGILTNKSLDSSNSSNWSDSKSSLDSPDSIGYNASPLSLKLQNKFFTDNPQDRNFLGVSNISVPFGSHESEIDRNRCAIETRSHSLISDNLFDYVPDTQKSAKMSIEPGNNLSRSLSDPNFSNTNTNTRTLDKLNNNPTAIKIANSTKYPVIKIIKCKSTLKSSKLKRILNGKFSRNEAQTLNRNRMSIDESFDQKKGSQNDSSWRYTRHYKFKPSKSLNSRATLDFPLISSFSETLISKYKVHKRLSGALAKRKVLNSSKKVLSPGNLNVLKSDFEIGDDINNNTNIDDSEAEANTDLSNSSSKCVGLDKLVAGIGVVKFSDICQRLLSSTMSKYDNYDTHFPVQLLVSVRESQGKTTFRFGAQERADNMALIDTEVKINEPSLELEKNGILSSELNISKVRDALEYLNLLSYRIELLAAHVIHCKKTKTNLSNTNKSSSKNLFMENFSKCHTIDINFYKPHPIPLRLDSKLILDHEKTKKDGSIIDLGTKKESELQLCYKVFKILADRIEISAFILSDYL